MPVAFALLVFEFRLERLEPARSDRERCALFFLRLESHGKKANASPTSPIVIAGSITRRIGFFNLFKLIPSRNGMTARLTKPETSRAMLSRPRP